MRQENIAIYNELTKQHNILNATIRALNANVIGENFVACVARAIRTSSADFIVKNIPATAKAVYDKMDHLKYALEQTKLDGLFLEFGVFQGITINLISSIKPNKIIYGFDSFEGLPEDWTNTLTKGMFDTKGVLPKVNENVRLIKGWFNETLPDFAKEHSEVCAFIHVDSDLYSSAKTIFDNLKDKIVSGTVIVFDEYFNYPCWEKGEHKAFTEFVEESNLDYEYISYSSMQVAAKIK